MQKWQQPSDLKPEDVSNDVSVIKTDKFLGRTDQLPFDLKITLDAMSVIGYS